MIKKTKMALSCAALLLASAFWIPAAAHAEVSVNINIPLPALVFPGPPALVVIPGTYAYYPPDVDVDIFFYHGYWYRPYGGGWYISGGYNGPWRSVGARRVPVAVRQVPEGYRRMPPGHERMPYGEVHRNWRTWENERHWDRGPGRDYRGDEGRGRDYRGHEGRGEGDGRGHGRGGRGGRGDD